MKSTNDLHSGDERDIQLSKTDFLSLYFPMESKRLCSPPWVTVFHFFSVVCINYSSPSSPNHPPELTQVKTAVEGNDNKLIKYDFRLFFSQDTSIAVPMSLYKRHGNFVTPPSFILLASIRAICLVRVIGLDKSFRIFRLQTLLGVHGTQCDRNISGHAKRLLKFEVRVREMLAQS